jgi:hypothetical protein
MNRFARRARAAVALAALTLGALTLGALPAGVPFAAASVTSPGSKVPFTDSNVDGWLTFCNRNDKPITSGSLYTAPFAWKTISSSPPPAGYRDSKARAALAVYQPIQYVNPGDWSGSWLTSTSTFTNPSHPVVQATNIDQALIGFTQAYPPHWDGLVEMRMMFAAIDKAQLQTPYAAAVLRVSGSNWTLVEGGGGSCSQGQGVSTETKTLPKKDLAKPVTVVAGVHPSASSSRAAGGSSASNGSAGSGKSSGGSGASGTAKLAASDSSTGLSGGALAGIGLGALALVWVAIGVISRRRRRATS